MKVVLKIVWKFVILTSAAMASIGTECFHCTYSLYMNYYLHCVNQLDLLWDCNSYPASQPFFGSIYPKTSGKLLMLFTIWHIHPTY